MCSSIENTILVLHLVWNRWEHVSPKSLHLQFLLLEYIQLEYDTAKFGEFLALVSTNKRYCANPHQQLLHFAGTETCRYPSAEVRFCPLLSIAMG